MTALFLWLFLIACMPNALAQRSYEPKDGPQVKGTHFIVFYPSSAEESLATDVLNQAEKYYNQIADDIGYTRYQNFWTWEERVKIVIYRDQNDYVQTTHQPAWSLGFSSLHEGFHKTRTIVSFKDQPNFLTELLPHEISHLILHDFIGFDRPIPLFLDEGVAQMEQVRDASIHYENILAHLMTQGQTIGLHALINADIRRESDPKKVSIFYAESLYIIDFLVKTYGKDAFRDLCRHLRDGDDFESAFKSSYPAVGSIDALEAEWTKYMMGFLS